MTITRDGDSAHLAVFQGDAEEFRYGIEGHAREDVAFAFPKFFAEHKPARATAEVVLRSGREVEKDVTTFDQDRIIEDFLRAYAKWMGW